MVYSPVTRLCLLSILWLLSVEAPVPACQPVSGCQCSLTGKNERRAPLAAQTPDGYLIDYNYKKCVTNMVRRVQPVSAATCPRRQTQIAARIVKLVGKITFLRSHKSELTGLTKDPALVS